MSLHPHILASLPHDEQVATILTASPAALKSAWAKFQGRKGGRPRSSAPRCNCGKMTLRRAEVRKHKCG